MDTTAYEKQAKVVEALESQFLAASKKLESLIDFDAATLADLEAYLYLTPSSPARFTIVRRIMARQGT